MNPTSIGIGFSRPERPVVVEDRDPLGGRDIVRAAVGRDTLDEVDDRLAGARCRSSESSAHYYCDLISISASRSRSTYGSPLTSTATRSILPPVKV